MKTVKLMVLLAAAVAAGAVFADVDSYLYWMVDVNVTYGDAAGAGLAGTPVSYDYAKISTDGGETYLTLYGTEGPITGADELSAGEPGVVGFASDPAFSSFLVELYSDGSDERVGWTTIPYSQALAYISNDPTAPKLYGDNPFSITANIIPEPSSGLLLLLGLAGLGLRRRRGLVA